MLTLQVMKSFYVTCLGYLVEGEDFVGSSGGRGAAKGVSRGRAPDSETHWGPRAPWQKIIHCTLSIIHIHPHVSPRLQQAWG